MDQSDRSKHRIFGLGMEFSPPDPRDHKPERYFSVGPVPQVYRAPNCGSNLNQGATPQCTIYAEAALARSFEFNEDATFPTFDTTEAFKRAGGTDHGAVMRNALNVWRNPGLLATSGRIATPERLLLSGYARLGSAAEIFAAIFANGVGAYFGIDWQNSWFTPGPGGILPRPDALAGGHAIAARGFDQGLRCPDGSTGALLLQNSWGNWGAKGFCWLPISYLHGVAWEAWSITDATNAQLVITPFAAPRKVRVTGDVACWNPKRPAAPVKTMHFGKRFSAATADATVTVNWIGLQPTPAMSGSDWLRLTGPNAGTFVRPAANVILV
jgi:hypothetical protein